MVDDGTQFLTSGKLSDRIHRTPEGFLVCEGVPFTRAGDFLYGPGELTTLDGKKANDWTATRPTMLRRTIDDINNPLTIASFQGKSVTIGHPRGFVNPHNVRALEVGTMQNVRAGTGADADKLFTDLLIKDAAAIAAIESGELREVSGGFKFDFKETAPGYGEQREIRGNHLALVKAGRCGPVCKINDAAMEIPDMKPSLLARLFGKPVSEIEATIAADEAASKAAEDAAATPEAKLVKAVDALTARLDALANPDAAKKAADEAAAKAAADAAAAAAKKAADEGAGGPPPAAPAGGGAPGAEGGGDKMDLLLKATEKVITLLEAMQGGGGAKPAPTAPAGAGDAGMCKDAATIAAAEVLVPGIAKTADVATKAIDAYYATTHGRAVCDELLEGTGKTIATVDKATLFTSAAQVQKAINRTKTAAGAAAADKAGAAAADSGSVVGKIITGDELQAIHDKHWEGQRGDKLP